jgi:aldehyde dehydrogenase (NAD+)
MFWRYSLREWKQVSNPMDRSLQSRILRDTCSGSVVVNDVVVNQIVSGLPFGGVGNSGMGSFHGRYTFDAFSRTKAVMRRSLWPDPDLGHPLKVW